jgi:adenosylcobyric acid synthase
VVGTLIHGLFENDALRAAFLETLRERRGVVRPPARAPHSRDEEYDRLAEIVRGSLDGALLSRLTGIGKMTRRG